MVHDQLQWFVSEEDVALAIKKFELKAGVQFSFYKIFETDTKTVKSVQLDSERVPYVTVQRARYTVKSTSDPVRKGWACITVFKVVKFPTLKVLPTDKTYKNQVFSDSILQLIKDKSFPETICYYVKFPSLAMFQKSCRKRKSVCSSSIAGVQNDNPDDVNHYRSIIRWYSSMEDAQESINKFEVASGTKYIKKVAYKSDISKAVVKWDEATGIPCIAICRHTLECQHAKDRNKAKNERRKLKLSAKLMDRTIPKKPRNVRYVSKKYDCPATIILTEMWRFPHYRGGDKLVFTKVEAIKAIKASVTSNDDPITKEYICRVRFPDQRSHSCQRVEEASTNFFSSIGHEETTNFANSSLSEVDVSSPLPLRSEITVEVVSTDDEVSALERSVVQNQIGNLITSIQDAVEYVNDVEVLQNVTEDLKHVLQNLSDSHHLDPKISFSAHHVKTCKFNGPIRSDTPTSTPKQSKLKRFLRNLRDLTTCADPRKCGILLEAYPQDLDDGLKDELPQFSEFIKHIAFDCSSPELNYFTLIKENNIDTTFLNIYNLLRKFAEIKMCRKDL